MTLHQASDLALEIQALHKELRVTAIGYFVPIEDLRDDTPWKLLVLVPGHVKPRVIESADDLKQYLPKPKEKPSRKASMSASGQYESTLF